MSLLASWGVISVLAWLDSLAEKVEGSNDRDTVAESPATLGPATTLWAYRPFDEPLDSLPIGSTVP